MKFLVDENLPPRLAAWLSARGPMRVGECGLLGAGDGAVAACAACEERIIVTQDADFERPIAGVRALRLGLGNASTAALFGWRGPRLKAALARF